MTLHARLDSVGQRFARVTTRAVVARPAFWPLFRPLLRTQFDALAPEWDARRAADALAPLEAALERVVSPPLRVLDLGTGSGKAARFVADRYPKADVVGVDVAPRMIDEAERLLPERFRGRVRFVVADATRLPFDDACFDLVLLLNMIPFFDELARVTAIGGTVVVSFSFGAQTPIYVEPSTLRDRLARVGFGGFEESAAGSGTAFLARRSEERVRV